MHNRIYLKADPIRDEALRERWALSKRIAMKDRCQFCHGKFDWRGPSTHHIIRFKRSDEVCNFLLGDGFCHGCCHDDAPEGQRITIGMACTIKLLEDPAEFDLKRLEELRGQPIELEPLPAWLVAKRDGR